MPRAAKPPSPSDDALIVELRVKGCSPLPTARQLERWRQAGAIPDIPRRFPGRRQGSESLGYPAGTAEQVMEFAALMGQYRNVDKALIVLFGRGWPVSEVGLKRSYEWFFDHAEAEIRRLAAKRDSTLDEDSSPEEIAEAAAAAAVEGASKVRVGRFMLRNVHRMPDREDSVDAVLASGLANVGSLALGGDAFSADGLDEAVGAMGLVTDDPEGIRSDLEEVASRLMTPALRVTVQNAILRELEQSRDIARWMVWAASTRVPSRGRLDPLDDPIEAGIRVMALSDQAMGDLAVPYHASVLLIFLPMLGESIEQAHADLVERMTAGQEEGTGD